MEKRAILGTLIAAAVVAGACAGVMAIDERADAKRVETRYLQSLQDIRNAQADMYRAKHECIAQRIEFAPDLAQWCFDGLKHTLDLNRLIVERAQATGERIVSENCPGPQWCPGAPAVEPTRSSGGAVKPWDVDWDG